MSAGADRALVAERFFPLFSFGYVPGKRRSQYKEGAVFAICPVGDIPNRISNMEKRRSLRWQWPQNAERSSLARGGSPRPGRDRSATGYATRPAADARGSAQAAGRPAGIDTRHGDAAVARRERVDHCRGAGHSGADAGSVSISLRRGNHRQRGPDGPTRHCSPGFRGAAVYQSALSAAAGNRRGHGISLRADRVG